MHGGGSSYLPPLVGKLLSLCRRHICEWARPFGPNSGAGHCDAQPVGHSVLHQCAQMQRALHLQCGTLVVQEDSQEGGEEHTYPKEVGEQVRQGDGEDGGHRAQDQRQCGDQEDLQGRQQLGLPALYSLCFFFTPHKRFV